MRLAVCILLVLHGAIHALGFVKAFGLAPLPQLRALAPAAWPNSTLKLLGVLWLLAGLACLASAGALWLRSGSWWQLAAAALVVSQGLIVLAWGDAKFGTVLNLILLVPVVIAAAEQRFERESARLVASLSAGVHEPSSDVVQASELAALPAPVALWLEQSGVVGKPRTAAVHLRQSGQLRTSPGGAWMPARAVQDFSIAEPGFVWQVRVRMARVLPIVGRDSYLAGHGRMLIRLGGVLSVVDARDARIDQGTLLRFLGELVWFPAAALRDYVRWEPVDAHSARATMTYAGVSGSAVFTFDAQGRVVRVEATRYLGSGAEARLEPWVIPIEAWGTFQGVRIPVRGVVRWQLASGDFDYYRWQIDDASYEPAARTDGPARNSSARSVVESSSQAFVPPLQLRQ